eukprot:1204535-Alexandrium_andersonii.AAC.1
MCLGACWPQQAALGAFGLRPKAPTTALKPLKAPKHAQRRLNVRMLRPCVPLSGSRMRCRASPESAYSWPE